MSRITRVPKQDHIRRNCWATFFKEPCLLAATCKKRDVSDTEKLLFLPAIQLNDAYIQLLFLYWKTSYRHLHIKIDATNLKTQTHNGLRQKTTYNHGQSSEKGNNKVLFKTGSPLYLIKRLQKNCSGLHLKLITNMFLFTS